MINDLPEKFVRLMSEAHGAKGVEWLRALPRIIKEIEKDWRLVVGTPFENLSYHFVAPCAVNDGGEAVLKIGFPEADAPFHNEAAMLRLYARRGAVGLLRIDEARLALLLERLVPGENLLQAFPANDGAAVETAIEVLRKIRRDVPEQHEFVRLDAWFDGFRKAQATAFPPVPLGRARTAYERLSMARSFLLHGDFHHQNVLSAERETFLAIDPKGIVGQIGYEISVFLNNHVRWLAADAKREEKLTRAVAMFSDAFEIEAKELREWAYAQTVLSAWWTFEENGENWKSDLDLAEVWNV